MAMVLPTWYSAVMDYDSRGPICSSSMEESVEAILAAVNVVIDTAIAQGQSLEEVRASLMNDDQLLSEEYRQWLSRLVDGMWAARVPASVTALGRVNRLESCGDALLQSA